MIRKNNNHNPWFTGLVALLLLTLSGCGPNEDNQVLIKGRLDSSTGYKSVSANATAHVSLIQRHGELDNRRIVAERSLHDIGDLPVKFKIAIGKDLINDRGGYALEAEILGPDGVVRWSTLKAVDVQPLKSPRSVTLALRSVGIMAHPVFVEYQCSDRFQFAARSQNRQAVLRIGNRRLMLSRSHASTGSLTSYADDHGNRLDVGSGTASLELDGHEHTECRYRLPGSNADSQ